ncbi:MAG: hypothetical protein P4L51_20140 [Puia sp.]|nr:hypothetical protein [Puia sp.]
MKTIIFSTIVATVLSITTTHSSFANGASGKKTVFNGPIERTAFKLSGDPSFKGSENFVKAFPEAMVKSYETQGDKTKVTFTWNGDALEAYYDLDGNLLATSHQLIPENLPMSVKLQIRDNYKDYIIAQALEFYHTENGLCYFVMIRKDRKGLILQVTPDGNMNVVKRLKS